MSSSHKQEMTRIPYQYQVDAARQLAEREKVGLYVAAGLGKTAIAELAWQQADCPKPCLVVTKAVGRHVWARDAKWILPGQRVSELWAGSTRSKTGLHRDGTFSGIQPACNNGSIVVTNYDILAKRKDELAKVAWQCLIFDEAHALKQGYCTGWTDTNRWTVAMDLARRVHSRRHGFVWEMTATPVRDRTRDLWGQLAVVLPKDWPRRSKWRFLTEYCDAHMDAYGHQDTRGTSNAKELAEYLAQHFIVLRRADVAATLPAITRDVHMIDVADNASREHMGGGIETAITRAAALKEAAVAELSTEYLSGGSKVVVVTSRRALATRMLSTIQTACHHDLPRPQREHLFAATVTGEVEVRHRVDVVSQFNNYNSGPAVLTATTDSLMESIDIHHADALIVTALPYTPAQIIQLEGRVGRLGGKPCTIVYMVAEGTIDEQIRSLLLDKLSTVERLGTDTQGGIGVAETLSGDVNEKEILANLCTWLEENG